ncbi:MAG: helix-turn-helix transcriptional regulator, partial [Bdellovibrionota bacterium]
RFVKVKMIYQEFKPNYDLAPFLECFWYCECYMDNWHHKVLPDNCIDILFDFSDGSSKLKSFVTGMMTKPIISTRTKILALRFKPGMAYSFFKMPLSEIIDQSVDLKDLLPQQDYINFIRVFDNEFSPSHLIVIENAISSMLKNISNTDSRIVAAISNSHLNVEELSASLGVSRQHLRRLFNQYVGLSPKQYFRVQRVNNLIRQVSKNASLPGGWAWIAQECGFTDQSHLIKDFKSISGETPIQYFMGT